MKSLILGGMLRKSDTVARYSRGQFIIMLSVDKVTNVRQVMERIKQSSACFFGPAGYGSRIRKHRIGAYGLGLLP